MADVGWLREVWAQVARGLLRKSDQATFQVRAVEQGDGSRLRLDIDALTPEGGFRDRLPIDVTALDTATGETHTVHAEQTAPGSYRAEFDLPAPDADTAGGGSAATTMFSVSSPELTDRPYVFGHTRSLTRASSCARTPTRRSCVRWPRRDRDGSNRLPAAGFRPARRVFRSGKWI